MGPTGERYRILQIHPTRQCNLRCLHCYSSSGPEERGQLPLSLLQNAVTDAQAEGYNVATLSGGEPLLYKPLRPLLEHIRSLGMTATLTTNGMLLDAPRVETLRGAIDLLAISLDGLPESHNRMRGDARAFPMMRSRLEGVRDAGIPFGFIFTLTQFNLHELDWVAGFALEQGAKLLQIHPLEEVGRAEHLLTGSRPDAMEAAFAYLEALRLRASAGGQFAVQLDLIDRTRIEASPGCVFADALPTDAEERPLADLLSPLVIEADATVVPLQYGFARPYALGSLHNASLRVLADEWRRGGRLSAFQRLCRRVFDDVVADQDTPFTDWYARVGQLAERMPADVRPALVPA